MMKFHKEWEDWIRDNLERGCTIRSLLDEMVKSGFPDKIADLHIAKVIGENREMNKSLSYTYGNTIFHEMCNEIDVGDRVAKVIFWKKTPTIVFVENFLADDECDTLIDMVKDKLVLSKVIEPQTGNFIEVQSSRSSRGYHIQNEENEFSKTINTRISKLMNIPVEFGESIQVMNYRVGEEYKSHYDFFIPDSEIRKENIEKRGQRVGTLIMYLNDVKKGGTTTFNTLGLTFMPKKGCALYFEYGNSLGQLDYNTMHSGDPVIEGEKWIATKWVRDKYPVL